jgi:hypothetical protein
MGIHGESGREQVTLPPDNKAQFVARELVSAILGQTTEGKDGAECVMVTVPRLMLAPGKRVLVLMNNLVGALRRYVYNASLIQCKGRYEAISNDYAAMQSGCEAIAQRLRSTFKAIARLVARLCSDYAVITQRIRSDCAYFTQRLYNDGAAMAQQFLSNRAAMARQ